MSLLPNLPGTNTSEIAAIRSWIARCAVDWLIAKIAASARSVRLVRNAGEYQQHWAAVGEPWRPADPDGRAGGGGDAVDVGRVHACEGVDVGGGRAW